MMVEESGNILVDVGQPDNNFKKLSDLNDSYQLLNNTNAGLVEVNINNQNYLPISISQKNWAGNLSV